jgi:hypothetical protein
MQTFAEYMAEFFESRPSLVWRYPREGLAQAGFTADSVRVMVSFEQREPAGPWHVVFEVEPANSTDVAYSAFEIFNGVFSAMEEFIGVREPESVVFATKRDKLAGVYGTYLRKESGKLSGLGYRLEGPRRIDPFVEFTLRRERPSGWDSR